MTYRYKVNKKHFTLRIWSHREHEKLARTYNVDPTRQLELLIGYVKSESLRELHTSSYPAYVEGVLSITTDWLSVIIRNDCWSVIMSMVDLIKKKNKDKNERSQVPDQYSCRSMHLTTHITTCMQYFTNIHLLGDIRKLWNFHANIRKINLTGLLTLSNTHNNTYNMVMFVHTNNICRKQKHQTYR